MKMQSSNGKKFVSKRILLFKSKKNGYLLFCGNSNSFYQLEDENNVPYYQIDIEIKDNTIKSKKGTSSYLRPGMTGIARIKVKQKKLMSYVLEKINLLD